MQVIEALNTRVLKLSPSEALTSADVRWLLTRAGHDESDADDIANDLFDSLAEVLALQSEDAAA